MLLFSFQEKFVSAVLQEEGILVVPLSPRMYLLLNQLTIGSEGILGILSYQLWVNGSFYKLEVKVTLKST